MSTVRRVRRERGSVISWLPADDAYYIVAGLRTAAAGIPPLHVAQPAVTHLESLLEHGQSNVPFGLLAGSSCVSPGTNYSYLLIEEVVPSLNELSTVDPLLELERELRSLIARVEHASKLVLGWYLGGMDSDLGLDPDVESVHRRLFPETWQVVLVRSAESQGQRGGFFRFERMTERFYAIPFFEMLPGARPRAQTAQLRSGVRWVNYRTAQSVTPLETPAVPPPARRSAIPQGEGSRLQAWFGALRRRQNGDRAQAPQGAVASGREQDTTSPVGRVSSRPPTPGSHPSASGVSDAVQSPVQSPVHPPAAPSAEPAVVPAVTPAVVPAVTPAVVDHVASEASVQLQSSEVREQEVPHVFINGVLVPLPTSGVAAAENHPDDGTRLRKLLFTILAFVMLVIGAASYVMAR